MTVLVGTGGQAVTQSRLDRIKGEGPVFSEAHAVLAVMKERKDRSIRVSGRALSKREQDWLRVHESPGF